MSEGKSDMTRFVLKGRDKQMTPNPVPAQNQIPNDRQEVLSLVRMMVLSEFGTSSTRQIRKYITEWLSQFSY
jgi:hypothetical protein